MCLPCLPPILSPGSSSPACLSPCRSARSFLPLLFFPLFLLPPSLPPSLLVGGVRPPPAPRFLPSCSPRRKAGKQSTGKQSTTTIALTSRRPSAVSEAELDHLHHPASVVLALYEALANGDAQAVLSLVNKDLEWWFHGPPAQQHMMHLLTGVTSCDTFSFLPSRVGSSGARVFVEGTGPAPGVFWVHIWTVKDGRISQLREYFNTSVTVTDLTQQQQQPSASTSRSLVRPGPCSTLWQSQLCRGTGRRSLPGLLVTI